MMWGPGWVEPRHATELVEPDERMMRLVTSLSPMVGVGTLWGWQLHTLTLGLTRKPSDYGSVTFRYRTIVVVVSRQNGKTTLANVRMLFGLLRGEQIGFTQQDRQKGREKFLDFADYVEDALKGAVIKKRLGEESIRYGKGRVRLLTPDRTGARGPTLDTCVVDEAAYISAAFMAAIRPTMSTREDAQIWMLSSAGDAQSTELARARATGRAQLKNPEGSTALLEFGVERDCDYSDEANWRRAVPTLGLRGGARFEALRDDYTNMDKFDFAREYLGVWSEDSLDKPIAADSWADAQLPDLDGLHSIVCAIDAAPDSSCAAIAIAGLLPDGKPAAALATFDDGDDWLEERLGRLWERWAPTRLIVDGRNPAARMRPLWQNRGYEVRINGASATAASCAEFASLLTQRQVKVANDENLTAAALTASRRSVAEGWAFDRRGQGPPIAPLMAVALAVGNHRSEPIGSGASFTPTPTEPSPYTAEAILARRNPRDIPGVHY